MDFYRLKFTIMELLRKYTDYKKEQKVGCVCSIKETPPYLIDYSTFKKQILRYFLRHLSTRYI